jgi:TPR repeat protein
LFNQLGLWCEIRSGTKTGAGQNKAGLGVQQDYSEALKWYQKAADQGDDWSQIAIDNLKKEMAK